MHGLREEESKPLLHGPFSTQASGTMLLSVKRSCPTGPPPPAAVAPDYQYSHPDARRRFISRPLDSDSISNIQYHGLQCDASGGLDQRTNMGGGHVVLADVSGGWTPDRRCYLWFEGACVGLQDHATSLRLTATRADKDAHLPGCLDMLQVMPALAPAKSC